MRRIVIFIGILFILLGIIEYIKYRQEFINSLDIIFQLLGENDNEINQTVKIYLLNEENLFEEISVTVDNDIDDLVTYIFELYTSKSNSLPLGYYTPINVSTTLCNLSYDEEVINLIISDDIYRSISSKSYYGLVWSYYSLGFEEINITTLSGKTESLKFKDYNKINLVIENTQSFASLTTIFYPTTNGACPISYLHNSTDHVNYIIEKMFFSNQIDMSRISLNKINSLEKLYIDISDPDNMLTSELVMALRRSIIFNNLYDDVIIIKNSEVFS